MPATRIPSHLYPCFRTLVAGCACCSFRHSRQLQSINSNRSLAPVIVFDAIRTLAKKTQEQQDRGGWCC
jgi:hypothetical protein